MEFQSTNDFHPGDSERSHISFASARFDVNPVKWHGTKHVASKTSAKNLLSPLLCGFGWARKMGVGNVDKHASILMHMVPI